MVNTPLHIKYNSKAIIAAALIAITAAALAYAATSTPTYKPTIFDLQFQQLPVTLDHITFTYDQTQARYLQANVTLHNTAASALNIKVSLILLSNNTIIAQSDTVVLQIAQGQSATATINIAWLSGKNVTAVTAGRLTVMPA